MSTKPSQSSPSLSPAELRRYGRHLVLPEFGLAGQQRLAAARVLLVGVGGLGSPAGLYLAAAGVGTIGVIDDDLVDETNLQRQILYETNDIGSSKVEVASERLRRINPHVTVEAHRARLDASNALELVSAYDVVVDGSDNFPTRYLVNDACVMSSKPNVWGAVLRFEGQASVFHHPRGPCYRCLFPEPPPAGSVPSCAEGGVLGVLPGMIGCLQANEAIKIIAEIGTPLIGRLVILGALDMRIREVRLDKNRECPVCSESPRITSLIQYSDACAAEQPVAGEIATGASQSVGEIPFDTTVGELHAWLDEGKRITILDVREPHEHQICSLPNTRLIPLRELSDRRVELEQDALIVVYCHHGPRSSYAVRFLREQGFGRATNLSGGIDAWSLAIDPSVPRY